MKMQSMLLSAVLLGAAVNVQAQDVATDESAWQKHWQQMQEYRQAWQNAKTPEERSKLREQHWQSMQSGVGWMGGCPMSGADGMPMGGKGMGMGMQGGKGMGPGAMAGAPTKEMLDMRIERMEQVLEQMREHRKMLDKQQ